MYKLVTDTILCMHNVLICVLLGCCCSLLSLAPLWQSREASSLGNLVLQCSASKTDLLLHVPCKRCASDVMVCWAHTIKCFKSPMESVNGYCGVFWYCGVQSIWWFSSKGFSLHVCVVHEVWVHLKLLCQKRHSLIRWHARFWHPVLSV